MVGNVLFILLADTLLGTLIFIAFALAIKGMAGEVEPREERVPTRPAEAQANA